MDVTLGKIKIDEKAKVYGLLNKILGYPSFELQIINRGGQIDDGWFMKDGMQTTHYCFIAVFTSATKEKDITFENITKLNALFINKAELVKYIYSLTPKDTLKDDIEWLRDGPEDRTNYSHRMFHLKRSSALAECPINLVMKRENILKLSGTCEIEITPQGIIKL